MSLDLSDTATDLLLSLASDDYITIRRTSGQVFDPVLGTLTGGATTDTKLVAAATSIPERLIDGERVQIGDKAFICDKQFVPELSDTVLIPDETGQQIPYRITQIMPVNHAGKPQIYKVFCRG